MQKRSERAQTIAETIAKLFAVQNLLQQNSVFIYASRLRESPERELHLSIQGI